LVAESRAAPCALVAPGGHPRRTIFPLHLHAEIAA
jgi:hypothetical protein